LIPSLVVDANVWVAAMDTTDRFHEESVAFLRTISRSGLALHAPAILVLEIACTLARRFGDAAVGRDVADSLAKNRTMKLEPLTDALLSRALHLGVTCRLRAADALYAATAAMHGEDTLVTWDAELIDRAGGVTPSVRLAEQEEKGTDLFIEPYIAPMGAVDWQPSLRVAKDRILQTKSRRSWKDGK